MPLRLTSAGSRGNKAKNIIFRICSIIVVLIIALVCVTPFLNVIAADNVTKIDGHSLSATINGEYYEELENTQVYTNPAIEISSGVFEYYLDGVFQWSYDIDTATELGYPVTIKITTNSNRSDGMVQKLTCEGTYYGYVEDDNGSRTILTTFSDELEKALTGTNMSRASFQEQYSDIQFPNGWYNHPGDGSLYDFSMSASVSSLYDPGTYYGIIGGEYGRNDDGSAFSTTKSIIDYGEGYDFAFTSGTDLSTIVDDTDNAFKAILVGAVASSYAGALNAITSSTESTEQLLTDSLNGGYQEITDNWARGQGLGMYDNERGNREYIIYKTAYDVFAQAMLPIAGVILAFIFAYQLYDAVAERNNMADMGGGFFIQFFARMIFLVVIVIFAWALTEWFFSLGTWIVGQTSVVANNNIDQTGMMQTITNYVNDNDQYSQDEVLTWVLAYKICVNDAIDFGGTLVMLVQGVIINIGMFAVSLIVYVIVYVRLVEMYLYCCISPIPLATMGNRSWRNTGINFVRSVFALALQGFIIYLCLTIFNIMISETIEKGLSGAEFTGAMWQVIAYSLILVFCMFKASSISKSIVDAM